MFEKYNSEQTTQFTSTGEKIMAHPDAIKALRHDKKPYPVVLHIMPTEKCNLKCTFCSVANRKALPDLPFDLIKSVIDESTERGLKAVILSGGGDPTLYPDINKLLTYLYDQDLQVGMITNGLQLSEKINNDLLSKLTWMRISLNTLDYVRDFQMPDFTDSSCTVGFSYIWNPLSKERFEIVKEKVERIGKQQSIAYIRLLPDCNLREEELENGHAFLNNLTRRLGPPYFHQYKTHKTPKECHLGRVHPVLYTDQMIYPCDSLVLNSPEDNKKFHEEYAICHASDISSFLKETFSSSILDTGRLCPYCVFYKQNKKLIEIIYGEKEPQSINPNLFEHVNFL